MMYIPFVQSGNPDEERPWLYKGYYSMPDGSIDMEMKRRGITKAPTGF